MTHKRRIIYEGRDLEAMTCAVNYRRWILDTMRPFLGRRCVEVGAGTGTFSRLLWESSPEKLLLVEPSAANYLTLVDNFKNNSRIHLFNTTFADVATCIREKHAPDSII